MNAVVAEGGPARPGGPGGIGERERLRATLVLSLLVHGMVVLGVGFALDEAAPVLPTLDVILTEATSSLTPEQADFLAQASNRGGGEHDEARRPRDRQAGKLPQVESGVAPAPVRAQAPTPSPPPEARVVTSTRGRDPVARAEATPPVETPRPLPPGERNIDRELAMARLAAEIHQDRERYAKRPNRKFVSASTREYEYASYLRAWVDRVERIGNLNYPDEARRRRLAGQVVISVAIRRDGTVERAEVVDSSGQPLLDQAALRIVRLAEPYPPLPATTEEVDVLHVTRTWQFLAGGEMIDR